MQSTIEDLDTKALERFAFAKNHEEREGIVSNLVPGSQEHILLQALVSEQADYPESWEEKRQHYDSYRDIRHNFDFRKELKNFDPSIPADEGNNKTIIDTLRRRLGMDISIPSPPQKAETSSAPTSVEYSALGAFKKKLDELSPKELMELFKRHNCSVLQVKELFDILKERQGLTDVLSYIIRREGPPIFAPTQERLELVQLALGKPKSAMLNEDPKYTALFNGLTTEELKSLSEMSEASHLCRNRDFVENMLMRLLPRDSPYSPACYDEAWKFVSSLTDTFNDIKLAVLYQRLWASLQSRGSVLEEDTPLSEKALEQSHFFQYLKIPRKTSLWNQLGSVAQKYKASASVRLGDDASRKKDFGAFPTREEEKDLVLKGLHEVLAHCSNEVAHVLTDVIEENYLNYIHAEAKLLAGNNAREWVDTYGSANVRRLAEETRLEFSPKNTVNYGLSDRVSLKVRVKNVERLDVSVFEINTKNYYKQKREEISTDVDVEGMVPNSTLSINLGNPQLLLQEREVQVASLDECKRGVYLVELSGGGKFTRAIVRKGSLNFFYRYTVAGTAVSVLDEEQHPITSDYVLLHCMGETFDGQQGQLTKQGEVLIPPPPHSKKNESIVVELKETSSSFAGLFHIDLPAEMYTLESSWFFERICSECLTSSCNSLPVLVRPRLLEGPQSFPVSLNLLEDLCIMVTWCTSEGGKSREELTDVKLNGSFDLEAILRVPVNAISLELQLVGYVRLLQGRQRQRLQSEHKANIPGITQKNFYRSFHLKYVDEESKIEEEVIQRGYRLYCLGKDGETCPADVNIIPHTEYDGLSPFISNIRARTNDYGFISLGMLEGVLSITVSPVDDQSSASRTNLELREGVCELYSTRFHTALANARVQARIPVGWCPRLGANFHGKLPAHKLFRVSNSVDLVADFSAQLVPLADESACANYNEDERMLNVEGLSPGLYRLYLSNRNCRAIGPAIFTLAILPDLNTCMDRKLPGSMPAAFLSKNVRANGSSDCSMQLLNASVVGSSFEEAQLRVEIMWGTTTIPRVHMFSTTFEPKVPLFNDISQHTFYDQFYPGDCLQQEFHSAYTDSAVSAAEERYVSERRVGDRCFAGTRLPRPSLLATPISLCRREDFNPSSEDFIRDDSKSQRKRESGKRNARRTIIDFLAEGSNVTNAKAISHEDCSFDFLPQGASYAFNLIPSFESSRENTSRGVIRVPLAQLLQDKDDAKTLSFLVTAKECSITGTIPVKLSSIVEQNLPYARQPDSSVALKYPLDARRHYVRQRKAKRLDEGSKLEATYMSDSKLAPFTCLSDAFRLLNALNPRGEGDNDHGFDQFTFLSSWPSLSWSAKLEKYSRFACSELHLFLFRKDWKFFDNVVRPLISCKRALSLVDRYLLGHNLLAYTDVHLWSSINAVEKCLIIDWARRNINAEKAKELSQALGDEVTGHPTSETFRNNIFEHAFASSDATEGAKVVSDSSGDEDESEEDLTQQANQRAATSYGGPRRMDGAAGMNVLRTSAALSAPSSTGSSRFNSLEQIAAGTEELRTASKKSKGRGGFGLFKGAARRGAPKMKTMKAAPATDVLRDDENEEMEEALFDDSMEDDDFDEMLKLRNRHDKQFYQPVEKTKELAESQYYRISPRKHNNSQTAAIPVTEFWSDFGAHCASYDLRCDEFVSENFPLCSKTINEQLLALALVDLPFQRPSYQTTVNESRGTIEFQSPSETACVIFNQEIMEVEESKVATGVVCGRTYFDPRQKTKIHNGKEVEHTLSPKDFVLGKNYGCQVVITNITSQPKNVDILLQIPEGSICVGSNFVTKVVKKSLKPFSTERVLYNFYFPTSGEFVHYPVQVSEGKELVSYSATSYLSVNATQAVPGDVTSWEYLRSYGEASSVLSYLTQASLSQNHGYIDDILWRCNEKAFWEDLMSILTKRNVFHIKAFSLAFLHYSTREIKELISFLRPEQILLPLSPYFESRLLSVSARSGEQVDCDTIPALIDNTRLFGEYSHLEFWRLVHNRAHALNFGKEDVSLKRPMTQWKKLLSSLSFRKPGSRNSAENLLLAYHFCLQDRSEDARELIEEMKMPALSKIEGVLEKYGQEFPQLAEVYQWRNFKLLDREGDPQEYFHLFYDYLAAYLELQLIPPADAYTVATERAKYLEGDFTDAKLIQDVAYPLFPIASSVALAYEHSRDVNWSQKFTELLKQLAEFGKCFLPSADRVVKTEQTSSIASKAASLHLEVDSEGTVNVRAESCSTLILKYYFVDVETLFSKEPFVFAAAHGSCKFGFAKPNYRISVRLPEDPDETLQCQLPQSCEHQNSMIEGLCPEAGTRQTLTYCANSLRVSVDETAGFVRVEDNVGSKAIPAVYIKVYSRGKDTTRANATGKFYKDGYTDILGRFDFASLSTDELDNAGELAILVSSSSYGAEVVYAKPPRT